MNGPSRCQSRSKRRPVSRNVGTYTSQRIDVRSIHTPGAAIQSGLVDVDREIYLNLNGGLLLAVCSVNRHSRAVCDQSFWAMKVMRDFGDCTRGDNRVLYAELYPLKPDQRLWWACERGYIRMVAFMCSSGVDIRANNNMALRLAAKGGQLKVVQYCVEHGADIHAENDRAIVNAVAYRHLEVVRYLVERGADIHKGSERALQLAAANGHLEIVKYLVERGADIHARNGVALYAATNNLHLEVVKYLIERVTDHRIVLAYYAICAAAYILVIL